jgi:hypothetical protein
MMEATSTSETSVNFYQTARGYNPEDSHLHTRRLENLKSYFAYKIVAESLKECLGVDVRIFKKLGNVQLLCVLNVIVFG